MIAFMLFKDPFAGAEYALCVRHNGRRPIAIPEYLTAGDIRRRKANAILQQVNANYWSNGAIFGPSGNGIGTAKTAAFCVSSNGNEGLTKKTGLA